MQARDKPDTCPKAWWHYSPYPAAWEQESYMAEINRGIERALEENPKR